MNTYLALIDMGPNNRFQCTYRLVKAKTRAGAQLLATAWASNKYEHGTAEILETIGE